MNKQEIYNAIIDWQMKAGEDFLDYFDSNLNPSTFMSWCLGRKYVTPEKYNLWVEDYVINKLEGCCANYYVYNYDGEYGEKYAVVIEDDWTDEGQEKAYMILAEFISEITVYQEKFKKFLEDK